MLHIGLRKKITVIPHHITGEKEDFLQKVFCLSFERRYFFTHPTFSADNEQKRARGSEGKQTSVSAPFLLGLIQSFVKNLS